MEIVELKEDSLKNKDSQAGNNLFKDSLANISSKLWIDNN